MTINTNNTTAACSGDVIALAGALETADWSNVSIGNKVMLAGAIAALRSLSTTQASAPRSASAGDGVREALDPVRQTLAMIEQDLRGCVTALGEGDDLGVVLEGYADAAIAVLRRDEKSALRAAAALAPPPIRIDRDVGIREACDWPYSNFTFRDEPGEHDPCYVVMPGGAMLPLNHHTGEGVDIARAKFIVDACNAALSSESEAARWKEVARTEALGRERMRTQATELTQRLAAISANTTAGPVTPFADFARAVLASNPLEGKGIQSITEQASSGVRSTKQREG